MGNKVVAKVTKVKKEIVRKAVLIGINYTGTDNELNGCINDSVNLKDFLIKNNFFKEEHITMLNDNLTGLLYPTKENIIKQFEDIVAFANNNNDKIVDIFISYSGHGSYQLDTNGDESDGKDEVLCSIDCDINGFIVDDDIKKILVDRLGENVNILFLSDSCHSGTVLDLKYTHVINIINSTTINKKIKDSLCNVFLISGCTDNQTSADAYVSGPNNKMQYQGAMTASFLKTFKDGITYKNLINGMRKYMLQNRFTQIPQLSSGKKLNVNSEFILCAFD